MLQNKYYSTVLVHSAKLDRLRLCPRDSLVYLQFSEIIVMKAVKNNILGKGKKAVGAAELRIGGSFYTAGEEDGMILKKTWGRRYHDACGHMAFMYGTMEQTRRFILTGAL